MSSKPRLDGDIQPGPPRLDVERFAPENRRRLSAPGLRTFLAISDLWGLSEEQRRLVLGLPSRSTFHNWAKSAREHRDITLDVDVLIRISSILGIHQALGVLHANEADAVAWLRIPHRATVFGGHPPLALIVSGTQDGLLAVRRFLDAARGGLYMPPNELDHDFSPYSDADIVFS
ncbi:MULTISPECIES: MbcA/ParS/Xre antitoxin family protein [unclassified Phenylobacterium]|uniref:MbcA/ParS/Xre antitoxin family protein n=1 Tax=unclassified Phenylobacterium TaxID=2640670 RepID=UPI0009E6D73D|nr:MULTISPECIES: MbcA/ParS/Xre antitoxin family protein [unclassified Phenylobacterium]